MITERLFGLWGICKGKEMVSDEIWSDGLVIMW